MAITEDKVEGPSTNGQIPGAGSEAQTDGSASFLRAARAGNLEKVLEYLKGSIDINTSNANGLNALHLAAKEGHVNVVNELLKRGANVNAATKKGNTALHIASLAGQEEVVKILVGKQANVNVQSQNGFTPLYMAAQENHDGVVRFLLANGANQSLATEDGFTPLAVALQQGHDRVVAVLLENDAKGKVRLPALHIAAKKDDCKAAALLLHSEHNPDVTSKSGFTPLHIAAHYGNSNIAALLLEKGADVNFPAKHQITPLHVAAKWGKINMVKLLLEKGAKLDASTRDGLTPLHCAARSGHDHVVELLLERNAPITAKTKNGLAPLHMASQGDHVDSARILLYHKAPVDDVTVDYLTALHVAAHCGHVGVAKLLLDRRAEPNARALNGFTPLHIACKKNRIKVVELLLKHGASIEATTESGLTPLHVASFMGCMNIVIYLLQYGANPDIPTVRGETPLHLAARANQTDIIRILLRNGAHVDAKARELQTALHIGARLGNADMVGLLLQHGAAVDAPTKDQYTPLHVAAREGQDEVAALLLDNGASLSAATKKGFTPLHLAAKHGNIKVARLLLQKDAPVDAQGKNGVTPLHVAAHYDHVNVALLLLEKGASPHAAARNGYTPLHVAARKDQMDIATTLLEYGAKPNAESRAGFTPLHLAAQEGHADVATLLVEHGAQCDAKAKNGLTPLHLSAQEDRVNVAAILAKNGATIDPTTKAGYTPLHVACHFGQINMIRFLLQHGSNVNATTAHGYTPLHQAAQQGHTLIINLLLEHRASPNATTNQGQTALSIAQRLGYISVVETLKVVTETIVTTTTTTVTEEKYKVVAPETMHETFMSDSEDEGAEDNMLGDQSFRYLTADEMKSLGDDSLPIDVTRDERLIESVNVTREAGHIAPLTQEEERLSPTQAHQTEAVFVGNYAPDNIDISRTPIHAGSKLRWKTFLVSFLVDARGGAMRGCRHSGVRVIIPPRKAPGPMRITCRYLRKEKLQHPPPLLEGEACASRILEVGPAGAKFLGPVIIEVPHFASLRGKEREITILRSDNGETWKEHTLEASEEAVQEVLNESFEGEELTALEDLHTNRITRILTTDFPQYFAVVTRSRQEVHAIGPEGGLVSSTVVPQVQAIFPEGALTKKIRVGLQAQPIHSDLVTKLLGNRVAVSPIVTVEPRRRKFHKPITLTIPVPQAATKGMINQYSGDAPTLRLLCSITGGVNKALWEDVTGSTPLTFVNDCVSFTTTVSARFWLMDCRQVNEATRFATELYTEVIHVPFMAKFVVFAKRHDPQEAQLRVFCMTDDKEDKTLETQEQFTEVAKSRDVEVLENKPQYLEFAGNLVPVTKSGEQLSLTFQAFRENRIPFNVRVKDLHQEALGRMAFMKEPRGSRTDPPQTPICNLNIALPEFEASRATSELVTLEKKYGFVEETGLAKPELIHRADLRLSDIARELGKDWEPLGQQLDIPEADVHSIRTECPGDLAQQALLMLRLWMQRAGPKATGNNLEKGLRRINREDIVNKCMFNVELVTDDVEKAVAKVHLDQSGFDTFREELGTSRNASLKRDGSLDASYDEPDIMKEAESAEETSSEAGSVHEKHGASEAKVRKPKKADGDKLGPKTSSRETSVRGSKEGTPTMALEESFDDIKVENHVKPSRETARIVTEEIEKPKEPSRNVPDQYNLITQEQLDELVEGVFSPETQQKRSEVKQIGPVIVEQRELSDSPDSIVKVVSVTKRTVTQLPVTEDGATESKHSPVLKGKGEDEPWAASVVTTTVEPEGGTTATVVRTVTTDVKGSPSDKGATETIITTQTTTTTSASPAAKQKELSANLLDELFGDTDKGKGGQYGHILEPEEVAKLKAKPGMKKEDLELLEQLFPDQSMSKAYPPEGLVPENVIIPEYRTFVTAEQQKKPMSPKKKERVLEKIGRALSQDEMEAPSKPRLLRAATVDSTTSAHVAEEPNKEEVKEPVIEMKRVEESKAASSTLPSEVPEAASAADEPLAQTMEFRTKPSDDAIVTKTTTQFQDVLDDGTVKHTVTTITRTTIIQEVEEGAPQADAPSAPPAADVLQPGAKPGESETWASDLDTSQVSVSSLPEDEKTEPTATLSSATTTAEPEGTSTSEPGVQTQVEEKEWTETDPDTGDVRRVVCKTTHTTVSSAKPAESEQKRDRANDADAQPASDEEESLTFVQKREFFEKLSEQSPPKDTPRARLSSTPSLDTMLTRPVATQRPRPRSESLTMQGEIVEESIVFSERLKKFQQGGDAYAERDVFEDLEKAENELKRVQEELEEDIQHETGAEQVMTRLLEGVGKMAFETEDSCREQPSDIVGNKTELKLLVRTSEPGKEALDMRLTEYMDTADKHEEQQQFARILVRSHVPEGVSNIANRGKDDSSPLPSSALRGNNFGKPARSPEDDAIRLTHEPVSCPSLTNETNRHLEHLYEATTVSTALESGLDGVSRDQGATVGDLSLDAQLEVRPGAVHGGMAVGMHRLTQSVMGSTLAAAKSPSDERSPSGEGLDDDGERSVRDLPSRIAGPTATLVRSGDIARPLLVDMFAEKQPQSLDLAEHPERASILEHCFDVSKGVDEVSTKGLPSSGTSLLKSDYGEIQDQLTSAFGERLMLKQVEEVASRDVPKELLEALDVSVRPYAATRAEENTGVMKGISTHNAQRVAETLEHHSDDMALLECASPTAEVEERLARPEPTFRDGSWYKNTEEGKTTKGELRDPLIAHAEGSCGVEEVAVDIDNKCSAVSPVRPDSTDDAIHAEQGELGHVVDKISVSAKVSVSLEEMGDVLKNAVDTERPLGSVSIEKEPCSPEEAHHPCEGSDVQTDEFYIEGVVDSRITRPLQGTLSRSTGEDVSHIQWKPSDDFDTSVAIAHDIYKIAPGAVEGVHKKAGLERREPPPQVEAKEKSIVPEKVLSSADDIEVPMFMGEVKDVHSSLIRAMDELVEDLSPGHFEHETKIQETRGRCEGPPSPNLEPEIKCDSASPKESMAAPDFKEDKGALGEETGSKHGADAHKMAWFLIEDICKREDTSVLSGRTADVNSSSDEGFKTRHEIDDDPEERQELAAAAMEWEERLERAEEQLQTLAEIADRGLAVHSVLEQEVEALKEKGIYEHVEYDIPATTSGTYRGPARIIPEVGAMLQPPSYDSVDVSPADDVSMCTKFDGDLQSASEQKPLDIATDEEEVPLESSASSQTESEAKGTTAECPEAAKLSYPLSEHERRAMNIHLRETTVLHHVLQSDKMTPDSENFESSGYESLGATGSPFKTLDKSKERPSVGMQEETEVTAAVPGTNTYKVEDIGSKVVEIVKTREKVSFDIPGSSDEEFEKEIGHFKEAELAVPLQQTSSLEDEFEASFSSGDLQAEKIVEFLTTDPSASHPVYFPQVFEDSSTAKDTFALRPLHEMHLLESTPGEVPHTPSPSQDAHDAPVECDSSIKCVGFSTPEMITGERKEPGTLERETATRLKDEVVHMTASVTESMHDLGDDHGASVLCQPEEAARDVARPSDVEAVTPTITSEILGVSQSMPKDEAARPERGKDVVVQRTPDVHLGELVSPVAVGSIVQSASETSFTASIQLPGPPVVGVKEIYEVFKETEETKHYYMVEFGDAPGVHTDVVDEDDQKRRSSPTAESLDDQAQIEKCSREVMMQLLDGFSQSDIELAEVRTEDEAPDIEDDMLSPEGSAEEKSAPSSREGAKVGAGASESTGSGSPLQSHREAPGTTASEPLNVADFQPQSSVEAEAGSQTSAVPVGLSEFESELGTEESGDTNAQKNQQDALLPPRGQLASAGTALGLRDSVAELGSTEHEESWKSAGKAVHSPADTPKHSTARSPTGPLDNAPCFDRSVGRQEKRSPLLEASPPEETDYNMEQEISPAKEYPDYLTPDMQVSVGVSPTEVLSPSERRFSGGDTSERPSLPTQKGDAVFVAETGKPLSSVEGHNVGVRLSESSFESSIDSPRIPLSEPMMAFENVAFAGEDVIDASSEPPDDVTSPCGTRSPYEVVRETVSGDAAADLLKRSEEKLQKEVCEQIKEQLPVSISEGREVQEDVKVTVEHRVTTQIFTEELHEPGEGSVKDKKELLKELFPSGTDFLTAGLNVSGIIRSPVSHKGNSDDEGGEEEEWADRVLSKIKGRPVPPTPPASPRTVQSATEVKEQVMWEAPVEEHIEETVEEVEEIPAKTQTIIEHDEEACEDSRLEERTAKEEGQEAAKGDSLPTGLHETVIRTEDSQPQPTVQSRKPLLEHIPSEISDEDLVEREQSPTGQPPDTCREWKDDFCSRRDSSPDSDSDMGGGRGAVQSMWPSGIAPVTLDSTTGYDEGKPGDSVDKTRKKEVTDSEAVEELSLTTTISEEVDDTVISRCKDLSEEELGKQYEICSSSSIIEEHETKDHVSSLEKSSPSEKKSDSDSGKVDVPMVVLRNKHKVSRREEKRASRDFDTQSGSETEQSHYYSFEMTSDSGRTPSRPTSSEFDVNVLSGHASSEYETCATSQDASYATAPTSSQEASYATAKSSLSGSSRGSACSVDSESSGHLGSLEASEASDTIVASAHEDLESDNESQSSGLLVKEPYDGKILESVIRSGVEVPFLPSWQSGRHTASSEGPSTSRTGRHRPTSGELPDDGSSSPFEMVLQEYIGEYSSCITSRTHELQQDQTDGGTAGVSGGLERGNDNRAFHDDVLNGGSALSDMVCCTRTLQDRMSMSHEEEPLSISESSPTQSEHTWQTSVETAVEAGQVRRSSCDADRYQRQSTMVDSAFYSIPHDEAVVIGDMVDLEAELDSTVEDDSTHPYCEVNGPVEVEYVPEYDDPYARQQRSQPRQEGYREDLSPPERQQVGGAQLEHQQQEQPEALIESEGAEGTQEEEQDRLTEEGYYTETYESNLSTEEVEGAMSGSFLEDPKLSISHPESELDIVLPEVADTLTDSSLLKDTELLERPLTPEPPRETQIQDDSSPVMQCNQFGNKEGKSSTIAVRSGAAVQTIPSAHPTDKDSADDSPPISDSFEFVERADVVGTSAEEDEQYEMVTGPESQLASLMKGMEVKGHSSDVSPSEAASYASKCEEYITHLHRTYNTGPEQVTFLPEEAMDVQNAQLLESKLVEGNSQQDFPFDLSYRHDYADSESHDYGELYTHQEVEEESYDEDRTRVRARRLSPISDEQGSTPDYDVQAGRKTFGRGSEKDDASTSSLQEFERLEAEMILGGKSSSAGSSDSFSGRQLQAKNSSEQDSVSVNSLAEFEKLEREVVEAESVDAYTRASNTAARLDEIDEGHESQTSDPGRDCMIYGMGSYDQKTMNEVEEIFRQARMNVAQLEACSCDPLSEFMLSAKDGKHRAGWRGSEDVDTNRKEYTGYTNDSEQAELPLDADCSRLSSNVELKHVLLRRTTSGQSFESGERRSSTSTATNFDIDSLKDRDVDGDDSEANPPSDTSALSIKEKEDFDRDSLHGSQSLAPHDSLQESLSREEEKDSLQEKSGDLDSLQEDVKQDSLHETKDIDLDSINGDHSRRDERLTSPIRTTELSPTLVRSVVAPVVVERIDTLCWVEQDLAGPEKGTVTMVDKVRSDIMVSSTDSLEPSSSMNTHATYQFETDSIMSSSLNSVQTPCEENTMVSSTNSLDPEPYASMSLGFRDTVPQAHIVTSMREEIISERTPSDYVCLQGSLRYDVSLQDCDETTSVETHVDEKGNTKTVCRVKRVIPQQEERKDQFPEGEPQNIEEQFKDYLRKTMGSPTEEEEVEERKVFDEHGNVTLTRTVKRHLTSEPRIHAQTFVGSDAEEKTRGFLESFKEIEPSSERDEYEGFDVDGNPIRVTQQVTVRPTVKTVTFTGPNAHAQMEEYMRTHGVREQSSAEDTPTSDSGLGACSMSSPLSIAPDPHTSTDLMTNILAPPTSPGLHHLPDGGRWTESEGYDQSGQPITSRVVTTRTTRMVGPDGQEQVITTTTTSGGEDVDEHMRRSMQGVLENFMTDQAPTRGSYFDEGEE